MMQDLIIELAISLALSSAEYSHSATIGFVIFLSIKSSLFLVFNVVLMTSSHKSYFLPSNFITVVIALGECKG